MATSTAVSPGCCDADVLVPVLEPAQAQRGAEMAKALADPVRIQIVQLLRAQGREVCQCDLQPLFGLSQPTLSHHLRKLVDAGLVRVERRGKWAYYTSNDDTLEVLRSWLS